VGATVVPRGGATGVAGGAEAIKRCVVLDTSRLNRILAIDEVSQTVGLQAGVTGGALEAALAPKGLTLGHDLGSLETSTVGGWVATASVGHASAGFGAIEDLVVGLTVALPGGDVLRLKPAPRSGPGHGLRSLFVGSEGALAVLTEAVLAVSRAKGYVWEAFRPHAFEAGVALVREIVHRGYRPLVLRLLDEAEARSTFGPLGQRPAPVLIVGFDSAAPGGEAERFELRKLAREGGARTAERALAEHWWDHRHDHPADQEPLLALEREPVRGIITDVLDVAGVWRGLPRVYEEVRGALLDHAEEVGCRLLHPTRAGAALEFPFRVRADDDREAEAAYLEAWDEAVAAALDAGGTIAHHQGVGIRSGRFMGEEFGAEGLAALTRLKKAFDPQGILNPGKLFPETEPAVSGRADPADE
jgi:alkyldihydroxyacetonephosphate synthase